jgi:hypothetical protein
MKEEYKEIQKHLVINLLKQEGIEVSEEEAKIIV